MNVQSVCFIYLFCLIVKGTFLIQTGPTLFATSRLFSKGERTVGHIACNLVRCCVLEVSFDFVVGSLHFQRQ